MSQELVMEEVQTEVVAKAKRCKYPAEYKLRILREVEGTGTLYGALKRLLDQGWIKRVSDPGPNTTDRKRKSYALTERGRNVLDGEIERLRSLLATAEQRSTDQLGSMRPVWMPIQDWFSFGSSTSEFMIRIETPKRNLTMCKICC